ncbi:MAG: hypothetical protein AAF598_04510, partial [Bacteroidota bacterium]
DDAQQAINEELNRRERRLKEIEARIKLLDSRKDNIYQKTIEKRPPKTAQSPECKYLCTRNNFQDKRHTAMKF